MPRGLGQSVGNLCNVGVVSGHMDGDRVVKNDFFVA